jgi:hypothetical protein
MPKHIDGTNGLWAASSICYILIISTAVERRRHVWLQHVAAAPLVRAASPRPPNGQERIGWAYRTDKRVVVTCGAGLLVSSVVERLREERCASIAMLHSRRSDLWVQ